MKPKVALQATGLVGGRYPVMRLCLSRGLCNIDLQPMVDGALIFMKMMSDFGAYWDLGFE